MLLNIIKETQAVRRYTDKVISKDDLEYIIDAGRYGQLLGDEQPWMFGIIDDKEMITELVRCCNNQRWIASAPVVIALCTKRMDEQDINAEKYRLGKLKEEVYNIDSNVMDIINARGHQVLTAAGNMALAAREKGIGSCIISYVDVFRASKALKVPNSHMVSYLLTLGYGENDIKGKQEKLLDDVVFYNKYDI